MESLKEGVPHMMVVVLQIYLCIHQLGRLMVFLNDLIFFHNLVLQLLTCMENGVNILVIICASTNCVQEHLNVIEKWIPMLGEDH